MKLYEKRDKKRKRNKRLSIGALVIAVISLLIGAYIYLPNSNGPKTKVTTSLQPKVDILAAAESGLLPWALQVPLSRMAVYPGQDANHLLIAGGLTLSGTSTSGIYRLNITNGNLTHEGDLTNQVHDAASSLINNQYGIFGGGTSNSVNTTQIFSASGSVTGGGVLPQSRSDAAATKVGNTTYIIGGYNGSTADPEVLTTTNGQQFSNYGTLPVPVRYAAVVAVGTGIYIFGGMATSGNNLGSPVRTVQFINTQTHSISILRWQLPVPLEGASAFILNNEVFVAGGLSTVAETIQLGVGTTQVPGVPIQNNSLTQNTIWAVNETQGKFLYAGKLELPVAYAGTAVIGAREWLIGGEYNGQAVSTVQMITPNLKFGVAGQPGAGSPYYGSKLLIADRGNDRILVMNSQTNITWQISAAPGSSSYQQGFSSPDDAFFANHGTEIISNQENSTLLLIGYPSGKILWSYGHPDQPGFAPGYLRAPDDAYLLKNGQIVVADDQNCRVLFISQATKQIVFQIGHAGVCKHGISLASPNGSTPLFNGNILVSEILGSWVSEYTPQGNIVWSIHLPIAYPSDPQQIGASPTSNPNHYLIADYSNPGAILQFTSQGKIISEYQVKSGPGMLNDPSLVELLPSGVYLANDDHRDRMVAIDPTTNALVWQYGVSDIPGTSYGMVYKPDGFDLLLPNGTTPTHLATM